jgi:RimJ/RimL family protein N-acetyltransferase
VRTWSQNDLNIFFDLTQNEGLNLFSIRGYKMSNLTAVRTRLSEEQELYLEKRMGNFGVFLKNTRLLIGLCAIRPIIIQNRETTELMFRFHSDHWGKGYAREAGLLCLKYGFEVLQIQEIVATVDPRNERSKKVIGTLGFTYLENILFCEKDLEFYQRLNRTLA